MDQKDIKVRVETSKELGRYLVAEEDYSPMDLILEEFPIVTSPSGQFDWNSEKDEAYTICIGCFLSLTEMLEEDEKEEPIYHCDHCGWPFCSKECFLTDLDHKRMECDLFKQKQIKQDIQSLLAIYFIRCLHIFCNDSARWTKIMNLSELYDGDCTKVIGGKDFSIHEYIQKLYDEKISVDLISKLNRIRNVNAFQINYNQFDDKRYYGMALYSFGSMAAHSCSPNSRWKTSLPHRKRGFSIRFEAIRCINKGHSITIAYRNKCLTKGTIVRRREIYAGHRFKCQCERCEDSTEFQTYFSSIHCTHCSLGYLLPSNSFDDKSDWVCRSCRGTETVTFVLEIIERITSQIMRAKERKCKTSEICWKLDTIIKRYAGRIIHPNNYLIIWAEFVWLQYLEYQLLCLGANFIKYDTFLLMTARTMHCNEIYSRFFSTTCRFYGYFQKLCGFAHYLYYMSPLMWDALNDEQRLRATRKTLEYFENSLKYDGWESEDLQFIDTKLRHIKSTVNLILTRMGKSSDSKPDENHS